MVRTISLVVPFVSPNPNHTRARYQQDSLTIEKRKRGPAVWVHRWREVRPFGQHTPRKQVVGTKSQFPSRAAPFVQWTGLRLDINSEAVAANPEPLLVDQLIETTA